MARKKDIRLCAGVFQKRLDEISEFLKKMSSLSDQHRSWIYDAAVIRVYKEFETFMLEVLVAIVNRDISQLSESTNVPFPKHLRDEVCEYLIIAQVGGRFFDFRGRENLIKLYKQIAGEQHAITEIIKDPKYKEALNQLVALRNFAAHGSSHAKKAALKITGQKKMGSAGAWLKVGGRLEAIIATLSKMAERIKAEYS